MESLENIKQIKVIEKQVGYSQTEGRNVWIKKGALIDKKIIEEGHISMECIANLEKIGRIEISRYSDDKKSVEPKMSPDDKKLKGSKKKKKEEDLDG